MTKKERNRLRALRGIKAERRSRSDAMEIVRLSGEEVKAYVKRIGRRRP